MATVYMCVCLSLSDTMHSVPCFKWFIAVVGLCNFIIMYILAPSLILRRHRAMVVTS